MKDMYKLILMTLLVSIKKNTSELSFEINFIFFKSFHLDETLPLTHHFLPKQRAPFNDCIACSK